MTKLELKEWITELACSLDRGDLRLDDIINEVEEVVDKNITEQLTLTGVSTWIKISDQEPPKNIEVLAQCPKGVNYLTSWRTNYAVFRCQRELDSSWDWKWKLID